MKYINQDFFFILDGCYTVGGPNPGKPCKFPFKWNGKTYSGEAPICFVKKTWLLYFFFLPGCPIDTEHKSKRWCSTKVDSYGNHVTHQSQYGYCSNSCPIHNGGGNGGHGGGGQSNFFIFFFKKLIFTIFF